MAKIFHNNKWLLLLSLLLIVILFLFIFIYRIESRKILKAEIVKISVEKPGLYYDYGMDKQKKDELNKNLDDFAYITYTFEIKNLSSDIQISKINIQPVFSINMKKNVYWYAETDAITDSQMQLQPNSDNSYIRRILIRRNGLTDDEIIKMAKNDNFKITYNTFRENSILSYGYNFDYVGYR